MSIINTIRSAVSRTLEPLVRRPDPKWKTIEVAVEHHDGEVVHTFLREYATGDIAIKGPVSWQAANADGTFHNKYHYMTRWWRITPNNSSTGSEARP